MLIQTGAATHPGRVRKLNEDAYLALDRLGVIADGMGGHAAGDVASSLAVEAFRSLDSTPSITPEVIRLAVHAANAAILSDAEYAPERAGMGTTISGVALVEYAGSPHWMVFNVGDSRVYRIAGGTATQLTVDHSETAELVALGEITPAGAKTHPSRSVITRSLGTDPPPEVDVWIFPTTDSGDTFLVCSDGVTNELADSEIAEIVSIKERPTDAATAVVTAAIAAGGLDNATAVVVAVVPVPGGDELADTAPRPAGGAT